MVLRVYYPYITLQARIDLMTMTSFSFSSNPKSILKNNFQKKKEENITESVGQAS